MSANKDINTSGVALDLSSLNALQCYKLLCGIVVPRPIAWVTTINSSGLVNAAPFSFFNVFSEDPPLLVLGLQHHADGKLKDTTRNIHENGEFVVNLCDESLAQAMNNTAIDFPGDVSETTALGLATDSSSVVAAPRLSDAPFSIECTRHASLSFGPGRELLVGRALYIHARANLLDADNLHVNYENYAPVGRLFGNLYTRQHETFAMDRQTYQEFQGGDPSAKNSS